VRRLRFLVGMVLAAGAVVLAVVSGGGLPIWLALMAAAVFLDLVVPDFQTPVFHELPDEKRERMRGASTAHRR
jgi:hypothetical protein